jgi:hypothetical protein
VDAALTRFAWPGYSWFRSLFGPKPALPEMAREPQAAGKTSS